MTEVEMFTNSQVRILETIARGLGARDEQERIIKLLEDHSTYSKWTKGETISMYTWYCSCGHVIGNPNNDDHIIALIKGDNK